jgi:DNA-binding winged helix-turn-helix (wHTH) protein/Flp pilus assembly protein TadD
MQVSFGDFVLDLDAREVRRGSAPIRLSPKAFQLLDILVTNRPKALSKAELQNRLWPSTFVVEKNLANLIGEIREALGEDAANPRFIRTVPRFGYAFREAPAAADDPPVVRSFGRRPALAAVVITACLGALGYAAFSRLIATGPRVTNSPARESYLRGRHHWAQDTPDGLRKALEYFQKARDLDPSYAQAYAGLSDTYALLGSYGLMPMRESHPLGRAAALKALELDDSLGEAHNSLAAILADYYWDWREAERHFRRAIELSPNDPIPLRFFSLYLSYSQRFDEALRLADRACHVDPVSVNAQMNRGVILHFARRYDEAVAQFEQTLDLDANFGFAHAMLGLVYVDKGDADRAVALLEKARALSGPRPDVMALHGFALANAGRTHDANRILDELRALSTADRPLSFQMAVVHVGLRDKEQAFHWLEKALDAHAWELGALRAIPLFDILRSDPRFAILLDRIGLRDAMLSSPS